jgi:hypothetical protein
MGGFKKESNNTVFEHGLFNLIVLHISKCCETMHNDCKKTSNPLPNHEDKISNRLVARYLNVGIKGIKFTRENPEGFDAKTDTFKGRTDIRVVSSNWLSGNDNAYYTVEAKRIDGGTKLNNEYVCEGISRFLVPFPPKYPSYYGKNIMLGYVVQAINISENAGIIDSLQRKLIIGVAISQMKAVCDNKKVFNLYQCLYQTDDDLNVELAHLFYDFSDVICKKSLAV